MAGSPPAGEAPWTGLDLVQWPAMVVTVLACLARRPTHKHRREIGFGLSRQQRALIAWGWHTRAWALIVPQLCLPRSTSARASEGSRHRADDRAGHVPYARRLHTPTDRGRRRRRQWSPRQRGDSNRGFDFQQPIREDTA